MFFDLKKKFANLIKKCVVYFSAYYVQNKLDNAKWMCQRIAGSKLIYQRKIAKLRAVGDDDELLFCEIKPHSIPSELRYSAHDPLIKSEYMYELSNAFLEGAWPLIYSEDGTLIKDSVSFSDYNNRLSSQLKKNYIQSFRHPLRQMRKSNVNYGILMFSLWNHFGHWIPEHLIKIKKIIDEAKVRDKDIKLILERDAPEWKLNILKMAGFNESNFYFWQGGSLNVKRLIVPSYPVPNYQDFLWIKQLLSRDSSDSIGGCADHIYLSRNKFGDRGIENEEELFKMLSKYNFIKVHPEELSIVEQVKLLSEAKVVIGPHGSSLTNAIFSNRATIIEFFNYNVPLFFYCYSQVMGHKHYPIYCKSYDHTKSSFMDVNVGEVENLIRRVIYDNQH